METDVGGTGFAGELRVGRPVDVEIDPGQAGIGKGLEQGIDALEVGERAEENSGGSRKGRCPTRFTRKGRCPTRFTRKGRWPRRFVRIGRCPTRWWRDAMDFEARGISSVFEQINGGVGSESAEFFLAPSGLDSEMARFGEDGFFGEGLYARQEGHGARLATGGENALEGDEGA